MVAPCTRAAGKPINGGMVVSLPYGGDISKARQAHDIAAIRTLTEDRDSHSKTVLRSRSQATVTAQTCLDQRTATTIAAGLSRSSKRSSRSSRRRSRVVGGAFGGV